MVDRRMTGRIVKLEERHGRFPWHLPIAEWTDDQLAAVMCDPVALTDGQLLHLIGYGREVGNMTDAELIAERLEIEERLLADPETLPATRADIEGRRALPWERPFDQWTHAQIATHTAALASDNSVSRPQPRAAS